MKRAFFTTALLSLILLCGGVARGQMVQQLANVPDAYISCCSHPEANILYVGGLQGVYKSTDNGETWTMVHEYDTTVHIPQSLDDTVYSIPFFYMNFMDENTGFATKTRGLKCRYAFDWQTVVGHPAQNDSPGLFKTSDGGVTWEMTDSSHYFINMQFVGSDTIFAYEKSDKTLYKSVNGGAEWAMVFNTIAIDDYSAVNGNVVYVMKKSCYIESGMEPVDPVTPTVYKTSDGGGTWTLILSNGEESSKAPVCLDIIHFYEEGKGVLMGNKQIFTEDDFTTYNWQGGGFTNITYMAEDIQSCYLKTGHNVSTCSCFNNTPEDDIKLRVSRDYGRHTSCQYLTCSFLGVNSITGCEEDTTFFLAVADQVDWHTLLYRIKGSDFPPVGIEEYEMGNVNVYPNPVGETLHVTMTDGEIARIEMFDAFGRIVPVETHGRASLPSPTTTVNTSDIPSGVYVLRVTLTDGTEWTTKIVKR